MAEKNEILDVLGILSLAYPGFGKNADDLPIEKTFELYCQLLADLPGEILKTAALQHIATSKWFPAVSELRASAALLMMPPERTALAAWGELLDTFTDSRYYKFEDGHDFTPQFTDPILCEVIKSMGGYWHAYECYTSRDGNPVADRARFIEDYQERQRRHREQALPLPQVEAMRAQLEAGRKALQQQQLAAESTLEETRQDRAQALFRQVAERMRR